MQIIAVLGCIFFVHSCVMIATKAQRYEDDDPLSLSPEAAIFSEIAYKDKRANKAEPTCEELRDMWIYSKRQSRAAETTNDLPMYRDPFSHNIWETYQVRSPASLGYRDNAGGQARSRSTGGPIVYGKVVHKAPAGSRLRNGTPNRMRSFEDVSHLYGKVNRQMPDPRRRQTSFRVGGGGSPSKVPQAGSFQHLQELVRLDRVRELQQQRDAEEIAARTAVLKEIAKSDRRSSEETRRQFLNSVQPYPESKSVSYVPSISNFGGGMLTGDKYDRDSMLHK